MREKDLKGSGDETFTVGVDGEAASIVVLSSVVMEGVVSIAEGAGVMSSAKTRVAFD